MNKQRIKKLLCLALIALLLLFASFAHLFISFAALRTVLRTAAACGAVVATFHLAKYRCSELIRADIECYKALNEQLECGVSIIRYDAKRCKLQLAYVNDSWVKMTGYSLEATVRLFDGDVKAIIYPPDRETAWQTMLSQLQKGDRYELNYRIQRMDGRIVTVLDRGRVIYDANGIPMRQSVFLDVSRQSEQQLEVTLNEAMLQAAVGVSRGAVFCVDLASRELLRFENGEQVFGYTNEQLMNLCSPYRALEIRDFSMAVLRLFTHRGDAELIEPALNRLQSAGFSEFECRIRKSDDSYIWCRVFFKLVYTDGKATHIVGQLANIDDERRKADKLYHQTQCDPLTNLWNKSAARININRYLHSSPDRLCAMLLLDIDGFKRVNDVFGHLYGDNVLMHAAALLEEAAGADGICGRMGGDEFSLFLSDVSNPNDALRVAQSVCDRFAKHFAGESDVTCSIGITLSSSGCSFESLFLESDMALYQAKTQGKNRCSLYVSQPTAPKAVL